MQKPNPNALPQRKVVVIIPQEWAETHPNHELAFILDCGHIHRGFHPTIKVAAINRDHDSEGRIHTELTIAVGHNIRETFGFHGTKYSIFTVRPTYDLSILDPEWIQPGYIGMIDKRAMLQLSRLQQEDCGDAR